jgi:hypothetical protein
MSTITVPSPDDREPRREERGRRWPHPTNHWRIDPGQIPDAIRFLLWPEGPCRMLTIRAGSSNYGKADSLVIALEGSPARGIAFIPHLSECGWRILDGSGRRWPESKAREMSDLLVALLGTPTDLPADFCRDFPYLK